MKKPTSPDAPPTVPEEAAEIARLSAVPDLPPDPSDLAHPSLYLNREMSWLEFNQRVLDQAFDSRHPLLERVKFLAIVGTNLDEFSMIRIATLLKKFRIDMDDVSPDGLNTKQQLEALRKRVRKMMDDQNACWDQHLRPALEKENVYFLEAKDHTPETRKFLKNHFKKNIFPVLTPLANDPGHPFPHISNLSLNIAVFVEHAGQVKFARVKIPTQISRFIEIPESVSKRVGQTFAFLEDVVRQNLAELFPDTKLLEVSLFRVVRDTDIVIQEDEADDLLETVDRSLKQLKYGDVSLLQVQEAMSRRMRELLVENFEVERDVLMQTSYRMGFGDWWQLMRVHRPRLKDPAFSPVPLFEQHEPETLFEKIKYGDYLVHHPYHSFGAVETFLDCAVADPNVLAIKMTLYRVGANSKIVEKLIEAAEADKQVTVLVELKARFDEKNNILWARRMEDVGIHVVYGLVNLKTHCKLCCAVRREGGGIRRYLHIGTGNYNPATAKVYTDFGLFTANDEIADDVSQVFNYLTGCSNKSEYKTLLVSPVGMRQKLLQLVEREIEHARAGRPCGVTLKNNAVTDPKLIQALYRASQAGVKVDMIVRGVCALRPGLPGISENIRVRSIVGRFLEHSRLYCFVNGGAEEMYFGSADLMERNLDRRVEVLCPIFDEKIRAHLKAVVLDALLKDNDRACELSASGQYLRLTPPVPENLINAQEFLLNWYAAEYRHGGLPPPPADVKG